MHAVLKPGWSNPSTILFASKSPCISKAIVASGDIAEKLLCQSRAQQADLIVLGVRNASSFTAIARPDAAYKVMTYAHCPCNCVGGIMRGCI